MQWLQALRGRDELEAYCQANVRICPVAGGVVVARVLAGPLLILDMRDLSISAHLAMSGFWESWITLAAARHVRSGSRCVDVGANCGYYTLLFASLVGPTGRVWACEPNPEVVRYLRQSVGLNGYGRVVEVVEAAIDDRNGPLQLHLPAEGSILAGSVGSVIPCHAGGRAVSVAGRTLDEVCGESPVDFVKIDAEGAELRVWNGMTELRRANPGLTVLMEFNSCRYDATEFLRQVQDEGCALRFVDYDGEIRPVAAADLLAPREADWMLWLSRC